MKKEDLENFIEQNEDKMVEMEEQAEKYRQEIEDLMNSLTDASIEKEGFQKTFQIEKQRLQDYLNEISTLQQSLNNS